MSLVQPAFDTLPHTPAFDHTIRAPFGAMVARQLSVWPFAARTARLFVLVDPSLPDQSLRRGLLRAMQQGYFASDGYSQTRAVREAALAAHYVLRHHNRDVLPLDQVNAASAVAAVRGKIAFVALAGNAAAFAWRAGELTRQHGVMRLPRPLGLEQDPTISLWRTPLHAGDRLVLVCGAVSQPDAEPTIRAILSSTTSTAVAERQLAEALGGDRAAGVLVVAPSPTALRVPHLRLLAADAEDEHAAPPAVKPSAPRRLEWLSPKRWLFPLLGLVLLATLTAAALAIGPQPGASASRVDSVQSRMAVRLGPAASSVADLVVGDGAMYTLDVAEGAVHAFSLDALEQLPTDGTVLAQSGTPVDGVGRPLALPVAIEYVPGEPGSLAIVDQARMVVDTAPDGGLHARAVPTSASWGELGALGSGGPGELLFVDSRAGQILAYPLLSDAAEVDPPRMLVSSALAPRLPFERVAQVIHAGEALLMRLDDGTIHRVDASGVDEPLVPRPIGDPTRMISAMASDRAGGLYLADPTTARIVQTNLTGTVLRELRDPALAGVRAIDVSLDGRRLYALVASGILAIDIPSM